MALGRASERLRAGQEALLDADAASLLQRVKDIWCEPTRAQIVRALSATPLSVTELCQVLGRTKWTISRHLRVLREAGLVSPRRRGRRIFYSINSGPAAEVALGALDLVDRTASSD